MEQFERFREVTSEIHRLIGIEPQAPTGNDAARWVTDFEIDEVVLAIMYSLSENPDCLSLVCVFGNVNEMNRDEVMACLLRLNFALSISGNASFSVNPSTNEVVFMAKIPIERSNSQSILTALLQLAEQAKLWRNTFFLNAEFKPQDVLALCATSMRA
jgi:hypothetical protein